MDMEGWGMHQPKGRNLKIGVRFFIRCFLLVSLVFAIIGGALPTVGAEDWRNLVQPTGTAYTGLLWQMEAEGPQGPFLTPTQANTLLGTYRGCVYPPFDATTPVPGQTAVTLIQTTKTLYFSRTFNTSDPDPNKRSYPAGSWVMRAATVRGLTAEQIRDVFALPAVPTGISLARVPAGHVLWTGMAGPINSTIDPTYPDWGRGGGAQTFIDRRFATPDRGEVVFISKDLSGRALLYAPVSGGGNAGSLASYFDSLIPSPATPEGTIDLTQYNARNLAGAYSSLDEILGPLDWLSFQDQAAFNAALNQLGPERYDALARVGVRNALLFGKAFLARSSSGYGGVDGGADSEGGGKGNGGVNFWTTGLGEFATQNGSAEHTGFDFTTGGFVMGADLIRRGDFTFGIGGGYLRSDLHWDNNGGSAGVNSAKFGVYSNYGNSSGWFANGLLAGGYNGTSVKRNIVFLDVGKTARSYPDGYDFSAQVRAGRDFAVAGWAVSPVVDLAYIYLHREGFDESGADPVNLSVRAKDYQTFRTQLGAKVTRDFTGTGGVLWTPSLGLAWAHEVPLDGSAIESTIAGQGGWFLVNGLDREIDSLVVDAGLKVRLPNGLAIHAGYGAEAGGSFVSHQLGLGLSYRF